MADTLPDLAFDDDLPDLDFGDTAETDALPDLLFEDEPPTTKPQPTVKKPVGVGDAYEVVQDKIGGAVDAVIDNPVTRYLAGKQQRLLNDPDTAGIAGAVLGPVSMLTGLGDTPIAETEYENRAKAARDGIEYTPQGPVDPLMAEKVGGSIGRILSTGGMAPVVEGVAKVADIAQHEPEEDLSNLKTAGRAGVATAATYLPIKAGAAVEGAVARSGLGRLGGFLANAGGDLAAGYAAGTGATVGEKALTGQDITSADFKPSAADIPFAIAAGATGAKAAGVRSRAEAALKQAEFEARANEPVATPERIAAVEAELAGEIQGVKAKAHDRLIDRLDRELEPERQRVRNLQAIDDGPTGATLALPAPEGLTAGDNPGRMIGLSPLTRKGATDGLQQREVQGETSGRAQVNRQSQEIAATPEPQAGEGVIDLAGGGAPAAPGTAPKQGLGLGLSAVPLTTGKPRTEPATEYNPNAGQKSVGGIADPNTQQKLKDLSYDDEAGHQDARRGTITREQTIDAATKIARTKGAELVNTWKKGTAYNAENLKAIESYAQGVQGELDIAKQAAIDDPTTDNQHRVKELESQMLKTARAIRGGSSEAGRSLGAIRFVIGGVQTNTPRGANAKLSLDDKARSIQHLDKVYGDKPLPQSVVDEIEALADDDIVGLATILEKHTRLNNKTSLTDAAANTIKAGYLTSLRTVFRNLGGLTANAALREGDSKLGSVIDWALSKKTGRRTVTSIGLGKSLQNAKEATKEGISEGLSMIKGNYTSEAANEALERFEIRSAQYTGENTLNKVWDGYVNTVFRATAAADMPARKFAFKQSVVNQAQVTAKNELASGAITKADYDARVHELVAKPSDDMILEAGLQAEMSAFADKNMVATGLNNFVRNITGKLEQRGTPGKAGAALVKGVQTQVVPFLKTPLNISWDIMRRSLLDLPTGVARGVKYSLREQKMSAAEQKLVVESIARGGMGTGLVMLGYVAGVKGWDWLTGTSEQESSGMRETNTVAGKQPGSLTAFGINARVQDVASPVSNLLILGNSVGREVSKRLNPEDEHKRGVNAAVAATKSITENPFFEGLDRFGGLSKPGGVTRFVQDSASSVIPNFVSDIGSLTDGTARDSWKQDGDTFGDAMAKSFMRKIPGLRNQLPPRVNALGEVVKEDKLNVVDATFSREARWKNDPAIGELVRLDVGMVKPNKRKEESEEQYLQRVKAQGNSLKSALDAVVKRDDYVNGTDEYKRTLLSDITKRMSVNQR